jgi:uncharacterized coiled-coil protein SlyX
VLELQKTVAELQSAWQQQAAQLQKVSERLDRVPPMPQLVSQ